MSSTTSTAGGELTDLSKYGVLSLVVGFVVLALKLGAWWVAGSVGAGPGMGGTTGRTPRVAVAG